MLDAFKDFLRSIGGGEDRRRTEDGDDPRVAAAAILFHVCNADGAVTQGERDRLRHALADVFGLTPGETDRIAEAGRRADVEAVDLYQFTSVLKAHLDEERRVRFVEILWDVTFADGAVHELEDNLIWRVSELLGVSTRSRMLGKREAAARSGASD